VALKKAINTKITAKFFGEGHTKDNVVGYFPSENVMFGGCLVKELNASKGYLGFAEKVSNIKLSLSSIG
jgi:metallo-beta-lactamase class B